MYVLTNYITINCLNLWYNYIYYIIIFLSVLRSLWIDGKKLIDGWIVDIYGQYWQTFLSKIYIFLGPFLYNFVRPKTYN